MAQPLSGCRTTLHTQRPARRTDLPRDVRKGMEMTPAIEVSNLGYRYPGGRMALESVTFSVAPGECVAILGPNGAGKSTLLFHLNGLLPEKIPNTPTVRVLGDAILRDNIEQIRKRVGFLFQDPDDQLISATVFEDVAFGPRQLGADRAELEGLVRENLALVGLAGFDDRQPHKLSHGEKRRVCLAGVLACKPAVLVLDEPTSGLDPRGRREFKQLVQALPIARIIATHDLELAVDICSRAIVLDQGRIVAQGPAVELLADEQLMLRHGLEKPHSLLHRHPHPCHR
jgi:cobalt/nickel transport system ATP-binding protein